MPQPAKPRRKPLSARQEQIKAAVIAAGGRVGAAAQALGMDATKLSLALNRSELFLWWRKYKAQLSQERARARWRKQGRVVRDRRKEADALYREVMGGRKKVVEPSVRPAAVEPEDDVPDVPMD